MLNGNWAKVLFLMWGTIGWQIKAKERRIASLVDYDYQCAFYYDAERIISELSALTRVRTALTIVRKDMAEVVAALPERQRTALTLKLKKRCFFYQLAAELKCSLRNAIYVYNRALDNLRRELTIRGYSDEALTEWFEGDPVVTETYARIKQRDEKASEAAADLLSV